MMKYVVVALLGFALLGCSKSSSDDNAGVAPAGQTSGGSGGVASTNENTAPANAKTYTTPQDAQAATSGGYRIVPADPSKFPSNAAGGDH